ncbi:MAG TPA: hypothetical protein VGP68_07540, partial [Gemmataceae bacterium]|nr:hypothetical protein [Gemmataceae bacterium]
MTAAISFNPQPAATADRFPHGSNGLGDRRIHSMIDGDKCAVAAGSGLNYRAMLTFAQRAYGDPLIVSVKPPASKVKPFTFTFFLNSSKD